MTVIPMRRGSLKPAQAFTYGMSAADDPTTLVEISTYDLIRAEDYLADLASALRKEIRRRVETTGGL